MSKPRKLKVDLETIAEYMQGMGGEEIQAYLDLNSGELHLLDEGLLRAVTAQRTDNFPDWQREMIPIAQAVLADDESLVEVPRADSDDSFEECERLAREWLAEVGVKPIDAGRE